MKLQMAALLAGTSLAVISPNAFAQSEPSASDWSGEIVVTARRRDERLQDVPLTVNAVSAETLQDLGIRRFSDVEAVVPGLTLTEDSIGPSASLRGVEFNQFSSGNNGTVEFYYNDAPLAAAVVLRGIFDVGQIEVLRGPQGTLRGRASPSGSITITSRKPDLFEYGGYVETTMSDNDGLNASLGVNVPIIEEHLAVRVAGLFDESEGNGVRSINSDEDPSSRTGASRISVLWQPTDTFSAQFSYQRLLELGRNFTQVESAEIANSGFTFAPPPGSSFVHPTIEAEDRLAVSDFPQEFRNEYNIYNWQFEYILGAHKINYVGQLGQLDQVSNADGDAGNFFNSTEYLDVPDGTYAFFGPGSDGTRSQFGQTSATDQQQESHEIRLSSNERLFGMFDYVVGYYASWLSPDTVLDSPSLIFAGAPAPATPFFVNHTPVLRLSESEETSIFGNVNWYISDATELSVGTRYISYQTKGFLVVNNQNNPFGQDDSRDHAQIYTASLKHRFADNFMAYVAAGSSWRPGVFAVGNFSLSQSALEQSHLLLEPETSDSYEIGFKSEWFDNRLRLNVTAYRQEFENYPYRGGEVPFVETFLNDNNTRTDPTDDFLDERTATFNFVSAVPVIVDGLEIETAFQATDNWSISAIAAYADGRIDGGRIACQDFDPDGAGPLQPDGIPDVFTSLPSVTDIENNTGGDVSAGGTNIAECPANFSSSFAPDWTASLQSEYTLPVSDVFEAFLRGQLSWYNDSGNDPTNPYDDVDSYSLLNLYAGIRAPDGAWDLTFFVKNATDTEEVVARGATPLSASYRIGAAGQPPAASAYRSVSMTPERQVGMTLRYAWGAR